jgi:thiazole synthase
MDSWKLGDRTFHSRIIVGTGKYSSLDETRAALASSGAEIVTVALRRVDLASKQPTVLDAIDRQKYVLLPNTAGCYTADEAIRTLYLARELGMDELVKLEVIGDPQTLFPDNTATVEAARRLVKEGFKVLPYCSDDLVTCKRLADVGCVMPRPR